MSPPSPVSTPPPAAHEATYVHEGQDGWLFLTSGSNNVIGQYKRTRVTWARLTAWARLIVAREARCRGLAVDYLHLIVPEKLTVYDHKLDGLTVDVRLSPARRLRRRLLLHRRARRACLDMVRLFRAHRDEEALFLRTDSHWSFAGCRLAFHAICTAWGVRSPETFQDREVFDIDRLGDLGAKLDPPRSERAQAHALLRDAKRIYASPIVEAREAAGDAASLHVGAHVVYRNDRASADPRRVILFGDSYSHFAPIMLTAMLAETFREVHFIWSSSIDWGYVERVRPDLLLTQVAERFMYIIPDDAFDLDAYAAERYGDELASG